MALKKIKKKIKNHIINLLSVWKNEVDRISNQRIISETISKLKNIGDNFQIELPYIFEGEKYISIGDRFRSRGNLRIEALDCYGEQTFNPQIIIGDNVTIESNCHIGCINSITIGNGVLIASNVFISDHEHGDKSANELEIAPLERKLSSKGSIEIGNNVWIGENVTILADVNIGNGVIIGAKSLVNKSFEDNCIIAGIPARIIRKI